MIVRSFLYNLYCVRRCFLSGGSPATSPSKSRVVEALCILLTEKHPSPRRQSSPGRRRAFTSRWNLVLSEYNSIRTRLLNSQALLEGTNLMLYTINETTLVRTFSMYVYRTISRKWKLIELQTEVVINPLIKDTMDNLSTRDTYHVPKGLLLLNGTKYLVENCTYHPTHQFSYLLPIGHSLALLS